MTEASVKSELRNTWESAAPGWVKWEHVFATSLSQATDALIDMAGISAGMRVLDIACGAGSQSIQAAQRVGPEGQVVASDISGTMLEHVRQNADRAGLRNIMTLECPADRVGDENAPFDAAICRLALMLIPSPGESLQAIRSVLKPGARFAAMVFATPANNPFLAQPMGLLLRHAGKSPPAPGQPGLFALGGEGVLEELMLDSGFGEVRTQSIRASLVLPNAADALQLMQEAAGAYRAVVADLSEGDRSRAWNEVHECFLQFEADGMFKTELEVIMGSGVTPA